MYMVDVHYDVQTHYLTMVEKHETALYTSSMPTQDGIPDTSLLRDTFRPILHDATLSPGQLLDTKHEPPGHH